MYRCDFVEFEERVVKLEAKLEVVMMPGTSRGRPPPRGCGEREQTLEFNIDTALSHGRRSL